MRKAYRLDLLRAAHNRFLQAVMYEEQARDLPEPQRSARLAHADLSLDLACELETAALCT
jgi:hypothetical protein